MSPGTKLPLTVVARMPKKRMDHATGGGGGRRECRGGAWDVWGQWAPGRDLPTICMAVIRMAVAAGFLPLGAASSRVVFTNTLRGCVRMRVCVCVSVYNSSAPSASPISSSSCLSSSSCPPRGPAPQDLISDSVRSDLSVYNPFAPSDSPISSSSCLSSSPLRSGTPPRECDSA